MVLLVMCAALNQVARHPVSIMLTQTCSYVCSRFYLHDPPGEGNAFAPHPDIPDEALEKERKLELEEPKANPWACIILLTVTVTLMAFTAEFVRSPRILAYRF